MRKYVMKSVLCTVAVLIISLFSAGGILAHHMAEGIVDEEVYAMIDDLVADTPHADLTFEEVPGMTVTTITTEAIKFLEDLIDQGIMDYFPMLDGEVTVTIQYDTDARTATMTITQIE